jgi:hypothetical protein
VRPRDEVLEGELVDAAEDVDERGTVDHGQRWVGLARERSRGQ